MSIQYAEIAESKTVRFEGNIRNYMTVGGYTKRCGAPTDWMVQLKGESRWRRVKIFCNSNSGTTFVSTKTNSFLVVRDYDLKGGE